MYLFLPEMKNAETNEPSLPMDLRMHRKSDIEETFTIKLPNLSTADPHSPDWASKSLYR